MYKRGIVLLCIIGFFNMLNIKKVDFIQSNLEEDMFIQLNNYRNENNLPELKLDLHLSEIARNKAIDLSKSEEFSHNSNNYGTTKNLLSNYPYPWLKAAENLSKGVGTSKQIISAFKLSDSHNKNLLSTDFKAVGIGCFFDEKGELYCAILFIKPLF